MATRPVAIPPELWQRLAALDARCDMSIRRYNPNEGSDKWGSRLNFSRAWEVRIGLTGQPQTTLTVMGGRGLADVLQTAVRMAEQNGWHRPLSQIADPPAPPPPR